METFRPNKTDPITGEKPPGMGKVLFRFAVLLAIAVVVLALAWNR